MTRRIAVLLLIAGIGCATAPEPVQTTTGESLQASIREQIQRLQSWDRRERIRAARALGKLGPAASPAVPYLVPLLTDIDLETFAKYEPTSIPALEAARALEAIGDPAAVEPLVAALRADLTRLPIYGPYIKVAIVRALGATGDARAAAPVVELLGAGLRYEKDIGDALARFGDGAFTPLEAALKSPTSDVRMSAARTLGHIGGPRAVALLIEAYRKETRDTLSESLASAFGDAGPAAFEPLVAMLSEEPASVRRKAVEALGRLRDRRAVEPLLGLLENDRSVSREKTMLALGRIGDPRALDAFESSVPISGPLDYDMWEALEEMGDAAVGILRRFLSPDYPGSIQDTTEALKRLGRIGTRSAAETLVAALQHGDPSVRRDAAGALGRTGQNVAVKPLAKLLADDDPQLRMTAAAALAKIKSPAVADALLTFEHNQPVLISEGLILALTEDKDGPRDVNALILILSTHPESKVRADAAATLGSVKNPMAVQSLIEALADPSYEVRASAVDSLGRLGDSRAVDPLVRNLNAPLIYYHTREIEALVRIGQSSVEPLVQALLDESFLGKRDAARALGKLRSARAVDGLLKLLPTTESEARQNAAWALGEIGETRARPLLIEILKDSRRDTQMVIVDALRKLEGRDYSQDDGNMITWSVPVESPAR